MSKNISNKLLYKVEQCIDYQNLYALEESFNKCGLTIQTTSNNRMILCKLRNGKAITENVVDDYIFVGCLKEATKELSERAVVKITDFIRTNHGKSGELQNLARVWRNGLRMYNSTVSLVNEDVNSVADNMIIG